MVPKNTILLGIAGLFLGVLLIGQGTGITQTKDKTLKRVPVSNSDAGSGKEMFKDYCAACHGIDGKGDGPAVEFLKVPPPDLTTMAKRHNVKSVTLRVESILQFGQEGKEHGTLSMPVWGRLFRSPNLGEQTARMRINNLADFVESIQQK